MLRAISVRPRDQVRAADKPADCIALDHAARHRRRMAYTAAGGLQFLLDLEHAQTLREIEEIFEPEAGAYSHAHDNGHGHGH